MELCLNGAVPVFKSSECDLNLGRRWQKLTHIESKLLIISSHTSPLQRKNSHWLGDCNVWSKKIFFSAVN